VLRIEGLGLRDAQGVRRLDGIDLVVGRGEIVGIAGVEGNGQRELVAVLMGLSQSDSGSIVLTGEDITHLPTHAIMRRAIAVAPEGRGATRRGSRMRASCPICPSRRAQ